VQATSKLTLGNQMAVQYKWVDNVRTFFGMTITDSTARAILAEAEAQAEAKQAELDKASSAAKTAKAAKLKKVAFKADATDGDDDGLVQDGTIHERKTAPAKKPAAKRAAPKKK
jgi:uncharacterized membrane protein YkoI